MKSIHSNRSESEHPFHNLSIQFMSCSSVAMPLPLPDAPSVLLVVLALEAHIRGSGTHPLGQIWRLWNGTRQLRVHSSYADTHLAYSAFFVNVFVIVECNNIAVDGTNIICAGGNLARSPSFVNADRPPFDIIADASIAVSVTISATRSNNAYPWCDFSANIWILALFS